MARSPGRSGAKGWLMTQRANEAHRWSAPFSRHPGWWVFLLALTVRLVLILATGSYQRPERTEVVNIAIKLADNGEFADPYGPGTGPTAMWSPLYPLLLSGLYRLLGTGQAGEIGQEVFSSLIGSVAGALLLSIALAFHMGRTAGLWAGLCAAVLPVNFWSETKGSFESALCGLALLVVCWYFAVVWEHGRFSLREACTGGLIAGVALLTSPVILPVVALLLAIGAWLFRAQIRSYALWASTFTGVSIALLLPWAIRNDHVLGSPVFMRLGLGMNLMVSNNDLSHADYQENDRQGLMQRFEPLLNDDVRAEKARMGEVAFDHEQRRRAVSWIRRHPERFLELTAVRFVLFWFPRMVRTPQTILIRCEAIAGIVGFLLLLRTNKRAKWIIGAVWLGYPLIYYITEAFPRYRYPVDWTFVLLGAFAVTTVLAQRRVRTNQHLQMRTPTAL